MSNETDIVARLREMEPSEILKANRYLMSSYENGVVDLRESERLALVSEVLKERYSTTPFYRQKAERDPDYWSKFSGRVGNLYEGVVWKGRCIPSRAQAEED